MFNDVQAQLKKDPVNTFVMNHSVQSISYHRYPDV